MADPKFTPSPTEVADLLQRFADHMYVQCAMANSTVDLTVGYVRRMIPVAGLNPTHAEMERYVADMRRRKCSYGNVVNAMKAFERFSTFLGNPLTFVRPKKPDRANVATLSEAKIAVMISKTKNLREKAMLTVLATTGIRNHELIELRVRNVDIGQAMLCIELGKGAKGRLVYLTSAALEVLVDYLRWRNGAPDDFLFVTVRHGHQLQTQDVRKFVRVIAKRVGIKGRVWPHLLRHSLATAMLDRGASVYSIQALLGHSWITTTLDVYLHPSRKSVQADFIRCSPSLL